MTSSREIPNSLEQRAAELDCRIDVMFDEEREEGIDYGPYYLCDAESGAHVWGTGLPLEGIADALDCLEREQTKGYGAWADFGCSWLEATRPSHG